MTGGPWRGHSAPHAHVRGGIRTVDVVDRDDRIRTVVLAEFGEVLDEVVGHPPDGYSVISSEEQRTAVMTSSGSSTIPRI